MARCSFHSIEFFSVRTGDTLVLDEPGEVVWNEDHAPYTRGIVVTQYGGRLPVQWEDDIFANDVDGDILTALVAYQDDVVIDTLVIQDYGGGIKSIPYMRIHQITKPEFYPFASVSNQRMHIIFKQQLPPP